MNPSVLSWLEEHTWPALEPWQLELLGRITAAARSGRPLLLTISNVERTEPAAMVALLQLLDGADISVASVAVDERQAETAYRAARRSIR